MFDSWDRRVVHLRDESVLVDTLRMWPDLGTADSVSLAPRDIRERGLRFEAFHPGRLVAWVRQTSGGWLAVVETTAHSGDGESSVPIVLWTPARAVRRK